MSELPPQISFLARRRDGSQVSFSGPENDPTDSGEAAQPAEEIMKDTGAEFVAPEADEEASISPERLAESERRMQAGRQSLSRLRAAVAARAQDASSGEAGAPHFQETDQPVQDPGEIDLTLQRVQKGRYVIEKELRGNLIDAEVRELQRQNRPREEEPVPLVPVEEEAIPLIPLREQNAEAVPDFEESRRQLQEAGEALRKENGLEGEIPPAELPQQQQSEKKEGQENKRLTPEQVIEQYFSYSDAPLSEEQKNAQKEWLLKSESARNYASQLAGLLAIEKEQTLRVIQEVRGATYDIVAKLQIPVSDRFESRSWAAWDVAKQSYFFYHPEKGNPNYLNADPSTSQEKIDEMADRQAGFEAYASYRKHTFLVMKNIKDKHLKKQIQAMLDLRPKKENNTLSSKQLAKLGSFLRKAAFSGR